MLKKALLSVVTFAALSAACGGSSSDPIGSDPEDLKNRSCAQLASKVVLTKAQQINDTAEVESIATLYGGNLNTYRDVFLVRVTDDTEPSDYVVINNKLKNGAVEARTCELEAVEMVASGSLPESLSANFPAPAAKCQAKIKAAVLKEAKKINETAEVVGIKTAYAADGYQDVVFVRVSDETEPSDYVAIVNHLKNDVADPALCNVTVVKNINSGSLPNITGLP